MWKSVSDVEGLVDPKGIIQGQPCNTKGEYRVWCSTDNLVAYREPVQKCGLSDHIGKDDKPRAAQDWDDFMH